MFDLFLDLAINNNGSAAILTSIAITLSVALIIFIIHKLTNQFLVPMLFVITPFTFIFICLLFPSSPQFIHDYGVDGPIKPYQLKESNANDRNYQLVLQDDASVIIALASTEIGLFRDKSVYVKQRELKGRTNYYICKSKECKDFTHLYDFKTFDLDSAKSVNHVISTNNSAYWTYTMLHRELNSQ